MSPGHPIRGLNSVHRSADLRGLGCLHRGCGLRPEGTPLHDLNVWTLLDSKLSLHGLVTQLDDRSNVHLAQGGCYLHPVSKFLHAAAATPSVVDQREHRTIAAPHQIGEPNMLPRGAWLAVEALI